jgi:hypothetical protein
MPQVRFLETHPYTVASVDERAKGLGATVEKKKGSEVVLLVRAQQGFSKALWDHVVRKRRKDENGGAGVNLRAMVSMPMGSTARVSWGAYETLTIVCGGTGISFVSVLEYACRMMSSREDPKWKTTRVRFVWIMREFGAFLSLCSLPSLSSPPLLSLGSLSASQLSTISLRRFRPFLPSPSLTLDLLL